MCDLLKESISYYGGYRFIFTIDNDEITNIYLYSYYKRSWRRISEFTYNLFNIKDNTEYEKYNLKLFELKFTSFLDNYNYDLMLLLDTIDNHVYINKKKKDP